MTRAFRSIAGVGVEIVNATGAGVASVGVGVINATGPGVAGAVELSKAGGGVELISVCFCGLLHPAISRGKTTTNARKRQHIPVGNNVSISHLKRFSRPSDQPLSKSSSNSIFSWSLRMAFQSTENFGIIRLFRISRSFSHRIDDEDELEFEDD
jgi:hypothetical protein